MAERKHIPTHLESHFSDYFVFPFGVISHCSAPSTTSSRHHATKQNCSGLDGPNIARKNTLCQHEPKSALWTREDSPPQEGRGNTNSFVMGHSSTHNNTKQHKNEPPDSIGHLNAGPVTADSVEPFQKHW